MTQEPEELTRPCPSCGHDAPYSQRFCTSCGGPMRPSEQLGQEAGGVHGGEADRVARRSGGSDPTVAGTAPTAKKRTLATDADKVRASLARQEFGRLKNTLRTLRTLAVVGAVSSAVVVLWGLAFVLDDRFGEELSVLGVFALIYGGVMLVLQIIGAVKIYSAPLLWSVILASLFSLNTLLELIGEGGHVVLTIRKIVASTVAILYWGGVVLAGRAQRLMREYPELQVSRGRIQGERKVEGGVADQAARRRRQRRRGGRRRGLLVAGVALLLVLVGGSVLYGVTRPPTLDDRLDSFCAKVASGDWGDMGTLLSDFSEDIRTDVRRRGWDVRGVPAEIVSSELVAPRYAKVSLRIDGQTVPTEWRHVVGRGRNDPDQWRMFGWDLPPFEWPDVAPFVESFRQAWDASRDDDLLEHLSSGYKARAGVSLQRSLRRDKWSTDRPAMGTPDIGTVTSGRCRVEFPLKDGGDIRTSWECRGTRWEITRFRMRSGS